MSDHPDNIIAESLTPEMDAELLATTPKADGFPSFGCYQMIQCGYPYPDHGEMILRPFGDMDERGYLLPPKSEAMWVKRNDAENLQSRLTAAETRVRELVLMLQLHWIEGECFCLSRGEGGTGGVCTHCTTGRLLQVKYGWNGDVSNLRAELDKLKGKP